MTEESKIANIEKYRPKVDISAILKFVVNHPGLAVFIVYATIAVAGFIYVITFYRYFNLEVIIYLEIGDILVAGIKDPMVMLMVLGTFVVFLFYWGITYIQAPFSAWLDKKFSKGFFKFMPYLFGLKSIQSFWWIGSFILLFYFILFIAIYSETKSKSIRTDKTNLVAVFSDAIRNKDQQYSILGTSINYIFLYNHDEKNTLIIPLENVTAIKPIISKDASTKSTKKIQLNTKED